jgi:hypothetical protein
MLVDGTNTSVGAGATVNLFAGRPVEFIGQPSQMSLYLTADAAAATCQLLVNVGGNQLAPVAPNQPINVASAAGAGPKADEDLMATFAVPAGARLSLNVTNGAGAANPIRYRAVILP